MKKKNLTISWILYIIGVIILIYELKFGSTEVPSWTIFSFAALAISIPWILCIVDAIKTKNVHALWVWGLILNGIVLIPIYLIKQPKALSK